MSIIRKFPFILLWLFIGRILCTVVYDNAPVLSGKLPTTFVVSHLPKVKSVYAKQRLTSRTRMQAIVKEADNASVLKAHVLCFYNSLLPWQNTSEVAQYTSSSLDHSSNFSPSGKDISFRHCLLLI